MPSCEQCWRRQRCAHIEEKFGSRLPLFRRAGPACSPPESASSIRSNARWAARSPISSNGVRIVVNGGDVKSEPKMSPKPTMLSRPGTSTPLSSAARSSPMAIRFGHCSPARAAHPRFSRPGQKRHGTVPELPQQSQRLVDARLQIGEHLLDSVDPPVDHHEALALGQGPDLLVRQPSGDEDEAVDRTDGWHPRLRSSQN